MVISVLHRKESLILTAIEVMDELGIQGLSTREIAKRQGVSEATLFRHYKNKNELMLAVLDSYSKFDSDIMYSTRLKLQNPIDAIKFYVNSFVEYYDGYPAITAITQAYDILAYDPELGERIRAIFTTRTSFIRELVDEAQKAGQINPSVDSEMLADIIKGLIRTISLKWRFSKYSFSLKEYTLSTLDAVLDAFAVRGKKG